MKEIYFLYKNMMLQIDPFKSSCSQRQQYSEGTLSLKVLRKSSKKVAIPKVTIASAVVVNFSSKISAMLYEQLQLLLTELSN